MKHDGQAEPMEQRDPIPASLAEVSAAIATRLRWPKNLGIQLRPFSLPTQPETKVLALFIQGLADSQLVRIQAIEPLQQAARHPRDLRAFDPPRLGDLLSAAEVQVVSDLAATIHGVFQGATALFFEGSTQAVLVDTAGGVARPALDRAIDPHKDLFGPNLLENIAMLRQRLRDPALIAKPLALPGERAEGAALIHLDGRAAPQLLDRMTAWLQERAGEEAMHRGRLAGKAASFGLLPHVSSVEWPDKVAASLDVGHAVVLLDRIPLAFVAPVTLPALLYAPVDQTQRRPVTSFLRYLRVGLMAWIVGAPALVVAMLNYHQEMIPTPFLLGLASIRESAAFPVFFEVLGLELLQEFIREATFRLPVRITAGNALIGGILVLLMVVLAGLVGPFPALISTMVAFASFGLGSYDLVYMARLWRFYMLVGAGIFGLYGMAAVSFLLTAYLFQAESFGVPFVGETGVQFTAPDRWATRPVGGNVRAPRPTIR